jgi:hypothetical protein
MAYGVLGVVLPTSRSPGVRGPPARPKADTCDRECGGQPESQVTNSCLEELEDQGSMGRPLFQGPDRVRTKLGVVVCSLLALLPELVRRHAQEPWSTVGHWSDVPLIRYHSVLRLQGAAQTNELFNYSPFAKPIADP